MNERIDFDRDMFANSSCLIGVDEAGRGPLAGPVIVGGVKINDGFLKRMNEFPFLSEINDSKKLSPKKREILFTHLLELRSQKLLQFTTSMSDHNIIDRTNILEATTCAMDNVISKLMTIDAKILIDGKSVKRLQFPHFAVVKGDSKSFCIGAASIIAKVVRDRLMNYFDGKYPSYGFAKNKGYGTKAHITAIKRFDLSPIHRLTFCRKFYMP